MATLKLVTYILVSCHIETIFLWDKYCVRRETLCIGDEWWAREQHGGVGPHGDWGECTGNWGRLAFINIVYKGIIMQNELGNAGGGLKEN